MSETERIASILAEWQEKRDQGEDVDEDAILAAHPDLSDQLREKFAGLKMLDATRAGVRSSPSATRLRELPLDRYSDFRPAGEGGMGIVYWAIDTDLNREVAFKVIRPGVGDGDATTPEAPVELTAPAKDTPASRAFETLKQRFLQEAWVTGGLSHPGIVPVYELGQTPEGVPYYTMRFVKGEQTLANAIEGVNGEDIEERLKLLEPFLKVCDTLSYAHAKGVIHRDLKPDNIALGEFGEVVVIDWGLAKIKDRPDAAHERWQDRIQEYREATDLRTVASAMGTPGYMAPEAAKGQADQMDERSDVYSLGAILFEILTGRLPIEFATFGELVTKLLGAEPASARRVRAEVPSALSALCSACLMRDSESRPRNAEELAQAIRTWQAENAADRELASLLSAAESALSAAESETGAVRLRQLDRAVSACTQVLARRPGHKRAESIVSAVEDLRERGVRERERAARRRTLTRFGMVAASVFILGGVGFGVLLERKRSEAVRERSRAQAALAEVYLEKGAELLNAGRAKRALAYLSEVYAQMPEDPSVRLLTGMALRGSQSAPHTLVRSPICTLDGGYVYLDEQIACLGDDRRIRLLDSRSGELLRELPHPPGEPLHLTAYPDVGRHRVFKEGDLFHVLDLESGETRTITGEAGDWHAWNLESGRLDVVVKDGRVRFADASGSFRELEDDRSVRWTWAQLVADGTRLITGTEGGAVALWDLSEKRAVFRTESRAQNAYADPTGRWLALYEMYGGARLVDTAAGNQVTALEGTAGFASHDFSPDGRFLAFGATVGGGLVGPASVRVWDLARGEVRHANLTTTTEPLHTLRFSRDGTKLLAATELWVRVWDVASGAELFHVSDLDGWFRWGSATLDASGERILLMRSTAEGSVVEAYDLATTNIVTTLTQTTGPQVDLTAVLNPSGRRLILGSDGESTVRIHDAQSGTLEAEIWTPDGASYIATDARDRLLLAYEDDPLLWDAQTGAALEWFNSVADDVWYVVLSPNGRWIAEALRDWRTVHIWDIEKQTRIHSLDLGKGDFDETNLTWSADGRTLMTAAWIEESPPGQHALAREWERRLVQIWDAGSWQRVSRFEVPAQIGVEAQLSPDGRWVLALGILFDTRSGRERSRLIDGRADPQWWAFSPDSESVVVSHRDGTLTIWDVRSASPRLSMAGEAWDGAEVEYSPDGAFLVRMHWDRGTEIWDVTRGARILRLPPMHPGTDQATLLPGSDRLITVGTETHGRDEPGAGHVIIWNTGPPDLSPGELRDFVEANVPYRLVEGRLMARPTQPHE